MDKIDKKAMQEVIGNLTERFAQEHLDSPMFKHLIEKAEYFGNADEISTMIIYPFERCVELAISKIHEVDDSTASLWLDYDFIENNLSELCSRFYGSGCSVDRGRFLTKCYLEFKKTGVIPKFNWKQEYTFHYPKRGTMKQWLNFAEGVHRLKYGYNKEYLLALKKLIEVHEKCRKDKQKGTEVSNEA